MQVYPAYTAAGARIHVASDVANNVRSHSAPRLPPKEAMTPPAAAVGTPAKKKLSSGGGGHRVSPWEQCEESVNTVMRFHKGK